MERLTAENIVHEIGRLPNNTWFQYVNPKTPSRVRVLSIEAPEGPITIERRDTRTGNSSTVSISSQMIWRVANALLPNYPVNFDRILGGSYNTRSALEALIAHTPEFYYSFPGRIESINSSTRVKRGHKHLIWMPSQPHENGRLCEMSTDVVISEIPSAEVMYDALVLPESPELDIEIMRRHAQIQVALIHIGQYMGFRTSVAINDKGIIYRNEPIGQLESVVDLSTDDNVVSRFPEAHSVARLVDCIWFKNRRLMPAVMEIEHSTGVTSGLTRMKKLQDLLPPFSTRYVIVASDDERHKVYREANSPQFRSLNARFFPYSAVEELYALCTRRKLRGVTEEFLDCFMEPVVESA